MVQSYLDHPRSSRGLGASINDVIILWGRGFGKDDEGRDVELLKITSLFDNNLILKSWFYYK